MTLSILGGCLVNSSHTSRVPSASNAVKTLICLLNSYISNNPPSSNKSASLERPFPQYFSNYFSKLYLQYSFCNII